jgi:AcrR family transcriptional regulator
VDDAILDAAVRLLGEGGYARLSMEAVAAAATSAALPAWRR